MSEQAILAEAYQHHWALDGLAAERLAEAAVGTGLETSALELVQGLGQSAIDARDANRLRLGSIINLESDESLQVDGPCSTESGGDYSPVWDWLREMQEEVPSSFFGYRFNPAKPRSKGGWTGPMNSTNAEERDDLFAICMAAFNLGIPILTEVTESPQLYELAPFLSGFWLGTRDMPSTALRTAASAYHLPGFIKNGQDGTADSVRNALAAVRRNTKDNDGSGFNFGIMQSTGRSLILPVGEGNRQVGIIARGYPVPKELSKKTRAQKAIEHLSSMCMVGAEEGCAVILDLSHDVPEMFDIRRDNPNRVLGVLHKFHKAINKEGRIENAEVLRGTLAEVGVDEGRTDRNFVLDAESKDELTKLAHKTARVLGPKAN